MKTNASGTADSVFAPGAKLEKLAGGFDFTEGPTCDAEGNVFFTDQPNDRILKWSADGELSTFLQPAGRANGMCFDPRGNLIACADEKNELWSIAPDGKVTVVVNEYEGKLLNGPNDVWVRPDGALYFTDPFYKRPWWTHDTMPQDGQHVYFLSADRKSSCAWPTTCSSRTASSARPTARRSTSPTSARARPTGTTSSRTAGSQARRCSGHGSDGMTLDDEGNLYLTGKGVIVFDKAGKQIEQIHVPDEHGRRTSASAARTGTRCSSRRAPGSTESGCA